MTIIFSWCRALTGDDYYSTDLEDREESRELPRNLINSSYITENNIITLTISTP